MTIGNYKGITSANLPSEIKEQRQLICLREATYRFV